LHFIINTASAGCSARRRRKTFFNGFYACRKPLKRLEPAPLPTPR
jgi:hypothetical protein